jgi:hypothetical protein
MHNVIPNRLPEPPPVSADGFYLDLMDGERVIGWIAPDAIGFRGFANDVEAAHAAWVAYRALSRHIAQRDGGAMLPIDAPPLAILDRSNERLVIANNRSIARLVDPSRDVESGAPSHAFELQLDGPRDELTVRSKAHLVYRALRRAGVRWAMWRPARPLAGVVAATTDEKPDAHMRVSSPLPVWAAAVSAVLLIVAIALVAPDAALAIGALIGMIALIIVRLVGLHRGWPPRGMPRAVGRGVPGRKKHYDERGLHAARGA